jgi:hypothetical protein
MSSMNLSTMHILLITTTQYDTECKYCRLNIFSTICFVHKYVYICIYTDIYICIYAYV